MIPENVSVAGGAGAGAGPGTASSKLSLEPRSFMEPVIPTNASQSGAALDA